MLKRLSMCNVLLLLGIMISGSYCYGQETEDRIEEEVVEVMETVAPEEDNDHIDYSKPNAYDHFEHETSVELKDNPKENYDTLKQKYNTSEFDYSERKTRDLSYWERLRYKIDRFLNRFRPDFSAKTIRVIYNLLIALVIGCILFVVYKLIVNKSVFIKSEKEEESDGFSFIEKNLLTIDLDDYIQQAKGKEKWNLAIRYLHLKNLQKLAHKGWIVWDHRKTNQQIQEEIQSEKLKESFAHTQHLFNHIWFGDFQLTQEAFENYQNDFIHFNQEIE